MHICICIYIYKYWIYPPTQDALVSTRVIFKVIFGWFLISFFCRSLARITSLRVAFQSSLLLLGKPNVERHVNQSPRDIQIIWGFVTQQVFKYTMFLLSIKREMLEASPKKWLMRCLLLGEMKFVWFPISFIPLPKTAGSPLLNRPFRPWSPKGPRLSCSNNGHTKELEKIQEKAAAKVPVCFGAEKLPFLSIFWLEIWGEKSWMSKMLAGAWQIFGDSPIKMTAGIPENDGSQEESPLPMVYFQVPC